MIKNEKPYYSLKSYLMKRFGSPVKRIALDAGFTCPNRDGTLSYGGCFFCGEDGARASYVKPMLSVHDQLLERIHFWHTKGFQGKFIAYFQAYTNTYASPEVLTRLYEAALVQDVIGIFVGTRPDCLSDEVLDVLRHLSQKVWVTVEIGVQTTHDATLALMNRGHSAKASQEALLRLGKCGLDRLVHLIGGLPRENKDIFLSTVKDIQAWGCEAVKFHHLFIERNTVFEKWYREGKLSLLSREHYIEWIAEALARLSPNIVIHRLFGETSHEKLVAPLWTQEKAKNIQLLEKWMKEQNIWQGKEYQKR